MAIELTDRKLRSLKPPLTGRVEVSDANEKGLRLRLSAKGSAIWMFEKRIKGGPKRKHTIGPWPDVSLSEAREFALEIEAEARKGIDRIEIGQVAKRKRAEDAARMVSVADTLSAYEKLHLAPNLRTANERMRQLKSALQSHLNNSVADLTRRELQNAVDDKAQSGAPFAANRIRTALAAYARWAWRRGYIETDIGAGISKAINETARERVLTVSETREIFDTVIDLGPLWSPMVRLLILTAQRMSDIAKLSWAEVELDARRISLAGSRTKNGKPHITHLTDAAIAELEAARIYQERLDIQSVYVFTTTGRTPVSGISKVKTKLDKLINEAREQTSVKPMEHWRFHDLRTAFATAMAEAGEPETVVDRILNHVASGSAPSAVARVYNRAEQLPQRAKVLERWAFIVADRNAENRDF